MSIARSERLIEVFRAHDIGFFFYNGGGDSQDTAYKVSQIGAELDYPVWVLAFQTVDNDLPIMTVHRAGSMAKSLPSRFVRRRSTWRRVRPRPRCSPWK
jgi:6-phosphofructokinase 1